MSPKSFLLLLVLAVTSHAFSQPLASPEVASDGRVTFRLKAPQARQVQVQCEGVKRTQMLKDDLGVWSLTTEPLEPDIYAYSFVADGVQMTDPANPLLKYNLLNTVSQVHVPGPQSLPWEINDVPRGTLHHHFYKSKAAADERDFWVYTPPGYDPKARTRYPVLYLLHGYSDDASAWSSVGMANVIMDNLISRRQAKPMIIVMPLGYGTMEILHAGWGRVRSPELRQRNQEKFRDCLLLEVKPQVEKAYRVLPKASSRAIAGLSMGGAEALEVGLNNLDQFAWVGAFSAGVRQTNYASQFPSLDAKANRQLRLLWIGCGEQDGLMADNEKLDQWLDANDIHHTFVRTAGQHSFRVWRRYLANFAPLLFQPSK
jgi:enterochelin esterase family protein